MAFPVPKDVRGTRSFELVKGMDEMVRTSAALLDDTKPVAVGEWMKAGAGGASAKVDAGDILIDPALGAKVSWTLYVPGSATAGQGDALATKTVDLLSGTYQAKTKLYVTGSTYNPGELLVVVHDATLDGGVLDVVNGTATVAQIQASVGRVIAVANGVLHFEASSL